MPWGWAQRPPIDEIATLECHPIPPSTKLPSIRWGIPEATAVALIFIVDLGGRTRSRKHSHNVIFDLGLLQDSRARRSRMRLPAAIPGERHTVVSGSLEPAGSTVNQSFSADQRSIDPNPIAQPQAQDLQLSLAEAVLGGRVVVDTQRGPVTITIPPMTSSGRKFRIRAEVAGAELILRAMIVLPTQLDQQSLELIRRFAELNPEHLTINRGLFKFAQARIR